MLDRISKNTEMRKSPVLEDDPLDNIEEEEDKYSKKWRSSNYLRVLIGIICICLFVVFTRRMTTSMCGTDGLFNE